MDAMSENRHEDDDVARAPGTPAYPEDLARTFAKRPGMYIGEASFERALGFIQGLEHALFLQVQTPEDLAALPTYRYRELMTRRPDDDDRAAIARLEPVIAAVIAELQVGDEAT